MAQATERPKVGIVSGPRCRKGIMRNESSPNDYSCFGWFCRETSAEKRSGADQAVQIQALAKLATKACRMTSHQLDSEPKGRRALQSPGRVEGYKHAIRLFRSQSRFRN